MTASLVFNGGNELKGNVMMIEDQNYDNMFNLKQPKPLVQQEQVKQS